MQRYAAAFCEYLQTQFAMPLRVCSATGEPPSRRFQSVSVGTWRPAPSHGVLGGRTGVDLARRRWSGTPCRRHCSASSLDTLREIPRP